MIKLAYLRKVRHRRTYSYDNARSLGLVLRKKSDMPATQRGPYKSAEEYTEFVCEELLNFCALLHWMVLPPIGSGPEALEVP